MSEAKSPLARPFPVMPPIGGVTLRVARAGYKDWGRCDLTYIELAEGTAVAGVFTRNVCCSSEVELGRDGIKQGKARALVVNAGNSNAFTGYRGREAVEAIMAQVSAHLGCPAQQVFVGGGGGGATVTSSAGGGGGGAGGFRRERIYLPVGTYSVSIGGGAGYCRRGVAGGG